HVPEIEQALGTFTGSGLPLTFTPHLVPMNRGILVTAYASLSNDVTKHEIAQSYQSCYGQEPFIRLYNDDSSDYAYPETRWVKGSNFCDIAIEIDHRTNKVIAIGAIDNLVKGAAGQAIQNMNLVFGWEETIGLMQIPMFPA